MSGPICACTPSSADWRSANSSERCVPPPACAVPPRRRPAALSRPSDREAVGAGIDAAVRDERAAAVAVVTAATCAYRAIARASPAEPTVRVACWPSTAAVDAEGCGGAALRGASAVAGAVAGGAVAALDAVGASDAAAVSGAAVAVGVAEPVGASGDVDDVVVVGVVVIDGVMAVVDGVEEVGAVPPVGVVVVVDGGTGVTALCPFPFPVMEEVMDPPESAGAPLRVVRD
jgi:hypothetical protein